MNKRIVKILLGIVIVPILAYLGYLGYLAYLAPRSTVTAATPEVVDTGPEDSRREGAAFPICAVELPRPDARRRCRLPDHGQGWIARLVMTKLQRPSPAS
jgi:hypothetical protein